MNRDRVTAPSEPAASAMSRLSSRELVALGLGAVGIGAASLLPLPLAIGGMGAYLGAIMLAPWVAVPLVLLALPFSARPQQLGPVEIAAAEFATLLATAVVGVAGLARIARRGRAPGATVPRRRGIGDGAMIAAVAFLVAGLISLAVTEYPKQSLRELRWVIVEPICLFLVARATLLTPIRVRVTLGALLAAGVVAAMASLISTTTSGELLTMATRPAYPYQSPNHLGLFLGRTAAIGLALVAFGLGRGWATIALAPIGLALLRTLSLGAWLGVAGAALTVAALRGRRWVLATTAALLIGLAVVAVGLPRERTLGRFDPSGGTGLFRLQIWESSLHMLRDHPVLGIGLDNFLYRYRGEYILPEAWEEPNISHPHNWLLHFWLALGLPGVAAAIGMLAWMAARSRALVVHPTQPLDRIVGAAAAAILVDTLVHGSFDNSYFLFDAAVVWWLIAALLSLTGSAVGGAEKVAPSQSRTMGAELRD